MYNSIEGDTKHVLHKVFIKAINPDTKVIATIHKTHSELKNSSLKKRGKKLCSKKMK